jgi:uncharacterized membrane protein YbhN (UPF0104 family)
MKKTLKRTLFFFLHLGGFVLLYFLVRDLQWDHFLDELGSLPAWKYLVGLLILVAVYLLKSWRWNILNASFGISTPLKTALVFYFSAGFLSVITPGRLGEFAKIYFLKRKYGIDTASATSSVLLDRIWDVLVLSLFASISLTLFYSGSALVLIIIALLLLASLLVILIPGVVFRPLIFMLGRFKGFSRKLEEIYAMWRENRFKRILPALALSVLPFLMLVSIPILFSAATPYPTSMKDSMGAISISNILSFIPVTIAGFGTRELVFTEIWKLSNYPKEVAISISTSYFMVTYLGSLLIGGVVYLFNLKSLYRPAEIRKMKKENQA